MALISGMKLGPYEVLSPLGAGGMGEVYRARDSRLGRDVAIKVLPAHFCSDPVRRQRFEREAKTISSLNHPHICVLHDIGHQDGMDYLVMECVEGETLEKRLEKGPLPVEQVVKIGAEVADALGRAHRSGVVHRDLKPGNIMLTSTGAKLLDFGLAKPVAPLGNVATLTAAASTKSPVTEQGTIIGTFQYMSPEQVEGKELDGRSDIFSLGAVLYEMVTGRRAFEGKSQLSVASAILEKEPQPISAVKPLTPPALDHAVKKCLAKAPDERWQNASDLASELKWIGEAGLQAAVATPSRKGTRLAWAIVAVALALSAGLAAWPWLHREPQQLLITTLLPPAKARLVVNGRYGPPAISPDGASVAFIANEGGTQSIWIRRLDAATATRLPGTEGALYPFWSPDSRWLGFFGNGKLLKVPVSGGPPQDICAAADARGGSWGSDGTILLTPKGRASEVYGVAENGGQPFQITHLQEGMRSHRWPYFLPDGKHFLYMASQIGTILPSNQIRMASVDGKEDKLVLLASSNPEFADGWLLFHREGTMLAARMDVHTGR